jgi:hypothetical protein
VAAGASYMNRLRVPAARLGFAGFGDALLVAMPVDQRPAEPS